MSIGMILLHEVDPVALKKTADEFPVAIQLQMRKNPIRGASARVRHELDPWFLNTEGWELDPAGAQQVSKLIAEHDLVWIHNVAVANGGRIRASHPSVLDLDDVQSRYNASESACSRSMWERALAIRRTWLWKRREAILLRRFTILAVCSQSDREYLGGSSRIHVIPNGFDVGLLPPRQLSDPPRIGFIGLLRYPPNREGVRWFIQTVWPRIKDVFPAVRLRLIGAGAEPDFAGRAPDVDILGWLQDPSEEMASWNLMITPIQMGGGTRIKIAEGFARRIPVVSTSLGAFGYPVQSGRELLIADRPEDFGQACLAILQNQELANSLTARAAQEYARRWTWDTIAAPVSAAVEHALRHGSGLSAQPDLRGAVRR